MNRRLPALKLTANLRGLIASMGNVKKLTKKQTAAPAQHSKNPRKRSHLESAKYASSSFVRSLLRKGT